MSDLLQDEDGPFDRTMPTMRGHDGKEPGLARIDKYALLERKGGGAGNAFARVRARIASVFSRNCNSLCEFLSRRWLALCVVAVVLVLIAAGLASVTGKQAGGAWMGDGKQAGEVRTITLPGGAKMDLVWVEPGSFEMGSNDGDSDEKPVHKVTLTKGYWIGKTEVTQKQWKSVMGSNPSNFKGDDLPVERVSWNDCREFVEKVNASNPELRLSLPTEAQWEFAARGGTKSKGFEYAGGNDVGAMAWYDDNSGDKTHPVGTKKSNELGICDMSGNVWEWCADWYGGYPSGSVTDPTGPSSGGGRVFRGGGWDNDAGLCRSAFRDWDDPGSRDSRLGFRVAAAAGPVTDGALMSDGRQADGALMSAGKQSDGTLVGDGKQAGEVRTITLPGGANMDLVWVAPGSFDMGSNDGDSDETPVHKVTLTKGYWIGKTEVTQAQWKSVMGNNPSNFKGDDLPVERVSWDDCRDFVEKVNASNPELRLSLPTEAQWEFAARGGTKSKGFEYAGGDGIDAVAWYDDNSGDKTHPVGTKSLNELGICDMSGNVWEWCADWFGDYPSGSVTDPTGPFSGDNRVDRGGGWLNSAGNCRSALRSWDFPDFRYYDLGFRVAAAAGPVTDGGSPGSESATARPPEPAERAGAGATERAGGAWMGDGKRAGEVRTITLPGGAKMDLVWVAPGSFDMGSNDGDSDEKPVHKVTLTKGYWIGKTEVTQKQWKSVMGSNPSNWKGDDLPVECVSWNDCREFVEKVNASNPELRLSLPTEAQWEFAARGGTKSKGFEYAGGDGIGAVAWYDDNSGDKTHPVGTKSLNELGICDMSGNVWEWCADWYGGYPSGSVTDSTGPSSGADRVLRGGGWDFVAGICRSANRSRSFPDDRFNILGFRVAAAAGP